MQNVFFQLPTPLSTKVDIDVIHIHTAQRPTCIPGYEFGSMVYIRVAHESKLLHVDIL